MYGTKIWQNKLYDIKINHKLTQYIYSYILLINVNTSIIQHVHDLNVPKYKIWLVYGV